MRKVLLLVSCVACGVILTACGGAKSKAEQVEVKELENFPLAVEGFERSVILLEPKESLEAEELFMVEIIPGKFAEVDCNRHRLLGKIEEKVVDGFGYSYYEFNTDGNIASTRMACPDNVVKKEFVKAESMMVRYNSRLPIVVYAPQGISVAYRIWSAGELVDGNIAEATEENTKLIASFPAGNADLKQYVMIANPKASSEEEEDYKIEIVPGKDMKVDCNKHFLNGSIAEKDLQGFGYTYYEFLSEGTVASTMMACPDETLKDVFVTSDTKQVRYNSRMPVIVYSPSDYMVKFRVWKANELKEAEIR